MKSVFVAIIFLIAAPLYAQSSYPPEMEGARVEIYREVDSTELKLWVFGNSETQTPKPAIVFFFGGGWNSGSPNQFEKQARHFAERGMIAITADYRVKSRHGVKVVECVKDAKAAIAWVRGNASRLGIDPTRIAAAGGSAGGHLAASTGTILLVTKGQVTGSSIAAKIIARHLLKPTLSLSIWAGSNETHFRRIDLPGRIESTKRCQRARKSCQEPLCIQRAS